MSAGTLYVALKGDTKDLVRALKEAKNISVTYGKTAKKSFDPVNKAMLAMRSNVIALGAAWLGAQGLGALKKITDQYTLIDSKLNLVTKNSQEFNKVYKELFDISQETGTSFSTNATAFANLQLQLKDTIPVEQTLQLFNDLNKSLVVNGSTTQEAESFTLQLKQALGSGVLAGEEFRATTEANSYWAGQLAMALDTDIAGLRKMSKAQLLTRDVVLGASKKMSSQISKDYAGIEKTISRAQNELSNAWKDVIQDTNKSADGTRNVATAISELATTVHNSKPEIVAFLSGSVDLLKIAVENAVTWNKVFGEIADRVEELRLENKVENIKGEIKQLNNELDLMKLNDTFQDDGRIQETKDRIASLGRELKSLQSGGGFKALTDSVDTYLDSLETVDNKTGEIVKGEQATTSAVNSETIKRVKIKKDASYEVLQDQKDTLRERLKLEQEAALEEAETMTDSWELAYRDRYEIQSRALDAAIQLEEEKTGIMGEVWGELSGGLQTTFRTLVGDGLRGEFDSIGEAWDSVMSNMLSTFIGTVAEMVAEWAASGIADMFSEDSSSSSSSSSGGSSWWGDVGDWIGDNFFADGGSFGGGWRVVGEQGPELEYTGASRIFSNSDSKAMLSGQTSKVYDFEDLNESSQDNTEAVENHIEATEDSTKTSEIGIDATDVNTGSTDINTGSTDINTGSTDVNTTSTNTNTSALEASTKSFRDYAEAVVSAVAEIGVRSTGLVGNVVASTNAIENAVDWMADTIFGQDDPRGPGGLAAGSQTTGDTGRGNGVDDSGGGTPGHEPGGSFGLAGGGVVSKVLAANPNDDGVIPMKLGEGVIRSDTMKILDNKIRNGSFDGSFDQQAISLLKEIATKIQSLGETEINIHGKNLESVIDKVIVKKARSGVSMSKRVYA